MPSHFCPRCQYPIEVDVSAEAIAVAGSPPPGAAQPARPTPTAIVYACCDEVGVSAAQMLGGVRTSQIAFARRVAAYMLRTVLHLSYPEIGRELSIDHTSAMYGVKQMEAVLGGHVHGGMKGWTSISPQEARTLIEAVRARVSVAIAPANSTQHGPEQA